MAPFGIRLRHVFVVLFGLFGRYGYHHDELYHLAAGKHLAWGYDDQPPVVALLARLADELSGGAFAGLLIAGPRYPSS